MRALLVAILLLGCSVASASVISGIQTTEAGKIVELGGLDWMSLDQARIPQIDGLQMLQEFEDSSSEFYGWRYATRSEVETLLDSLWGGTAEADHVLNYDGAGWFFDSFGIGDQYILDGNGGYQGGENNPDIGANHWSFGFGVGECEREICIGNLGIRRIEYGASEDIGSFHDRGGLSTGGTPGNENNSTTLSSSNFTYDYNNFSHMLVRTSVVPIPSAVWLFGSGLGLLAFRRRQA